MGTSTAVDLGWVVPAAIGYFGGNLAIIGFSLNDKVRSPMKVSVLLNGLLFVLVAPILLGITGDTRAIAVPFIVSLLFVGILFAVLKRRDVRGISFGQRYVETLYVVDKQINFCADSVLNAVKSGSGRSRAAKRIRTCLTLILQEMSGLMKLRPADDQSQLCILVVNGDRLKVLSQLGISPSRERALERTLRCSNNPIGVAGKAVHERSPICIPDLTNEDDQNTAAWVRLDRNERKEGAIIAWPIVGSSGSTREGEPIAVMNVTSVRKDAWTCETVANVLRHISTKVETLVSLLQML